VNALLLDHSWDRVTAPEPWVLRGKTGARTLYRDVDQYTCNETSQRSHTITISAYQSSNLISSYQTASTNCQPFSLLGGDVVISCDLVRFTGIAGTAASTGGNIALVSGAGRISKARPGQIGGATAIGSVGTFAPIPSVTLITENERAPFASARFFEVHLTFGQAGLAWGDASHNEASVEETNTVAQFRKVMEGWRGRLFTKTLDALDRQISYLLENEEDLAELSRAPDPKSFGTLLRYLSARWWVKAPSLTLTRHGVFVASWRPTPSAKARLSIDFLDHDRARWSAVDAREKAPTMAGGLCPVSNLDEYLRPYISWLRL
jgi:hypothetical protein